MSLRVSNLTIARNYTRNLGKSSVRLNDLNYKAQTWTKFSTMAENTPGGVRAMELRRNLARLDTNRDNANSALSLIKAAEGQLSHGYSITTAFHEKVVQANTGTLGPEDREIVAQELIRQREQMVTIMNSRFSDRYLFGGLDITNPPYEYGSKTINPTMENFTFSLGQLKTAAGKVNDPTINAAIASIEGFISNYDGSETPPNDMATIQGQIAGELSTITTAYPGLSSADQATLQSSLGSFTSAAGSLAHVQTESTLRFHGYDISTTLNPSSPYFNSAIYNLQTRDYYVDIGLGIGFDANGAVDPSTVYKMSFNGLEIFGEGDMNIVLQMDKIIEALRSEDYSADYVGELLGDPNKTTGFLTAAEAINLQVTRIGADTNYLEFVINRMNDEEINLFERQKQVEGLDPAKAIMDYELEYTAYQAALQMGQRLLMPTLWDYVK